jgi:hypothetical protein
LYFVRISDVKVPSFSGSHKRERERDTHILRESERARKDLDRGLAVVKHTNGSLKVPFDA